MTGFFCIFNLLFQEHIVVDHNFVGIPQALTSLIVLQNESAYEFIARGYRPYEELVPLIEGALGRCQARETLLC